MIRIDEPADAGAALARSIAQLDAFAWCVLSSPNGAERFVRALRAAGLDVAEIAPSIAAVGPATAAIIEQAGGEVELIASRHVAEGLVADFPGPQTAGERVLLPQADVARPTLAQGLQGLGFTCTVVAAYRTVPAELAPGAVEAVRGADIVTFTSSSTVTHFCAAIDRESMPAMVASIGPITTATARELGVHVDVEANPHTIDGLVQALIEAHH